MRPSTRRTRQDIPASICGNLRTVNPRAQIEPSKWTAMLRGPRCRYRWSCTTWFRSDGTVMFFSPLKLQLQS